MSSPTPDPTPAGPPAPETLTGYRWPLSQIRITQPFGPARSGSWRLDGKPFHDGLDLATFCGDHVRAAHAGTVLAAGRRYDDHLGWLGDLQPYYDRLDAEKLWYTLPLVVVIDDGNGYRSIYAHFGKLAVAKGDVVAAGAFLGWEGRSGNASGCHLHYGLFSPEETATLTFDPKLVAKMLLPEREILRVDPQRVLPPVPSPAP